MYSAMVVFKVGTFAEQSLPSNTYDANKADEHKVELKTNNIRVRFNERVG